MRGNGLKRSKVNNYHRFQTCLLEPGEALYVPPLWSHAMTYHEDAVAIDVSFLTDLNQPRHMPFVRRAANLMHLHGMVQRLLGKDPKQSFHELYSRGLVVREKTQKARHDQCVRRVAASL